MDDLYLMGISGNVVFELTDARYDLISPGNEFPAWDFSSKIIGLGYNQDLNQTFTITWKPHRTRATQKGGITINLYSSNGKGVRFGQSVFPANENAVIYKYGGQGFANSPGHIIFDGGSQKTLKFVLYSGSSRHGAAIYLDRGSENITIKNCLIENGTPAIACRTWLPLTVFDPSTGFLFQNDSSGVSGNIDSYSAGVAIRSSLLKIELTGFIALDTIPNRNNTIMGNEISGFGYGVLSLGMGTLYLQNEAKYARYYNNNNIISGNIIHDVCRAGVMLGYEENTTVSNNRIYNIGTGTTDAAGIMAGGNSRGNIDGFNNIGLKIDGNEISNITSPSMVHGVRVEQVRRTFPVAAGGVVNFPDIPENNIVMNNVIWGLSPSNASATVAGIHLYTERNASVSDPLLRMLTPRHTQYMTRNDKIVNNTVILSNDGGLVNTGAMAAIGVQQSSGAVLYNNAIAIEDVSIDGSNPAAAAVFYEGILPGNGGIFSDRNVYWTGSTNSTIYRFVQTDAQSNILEYGYRDEFKTLSQWRRFTGADGNSAVGNFMQDLSYTGQDPKQLRVNMIPEAPLGSLLNNRGDRLNYVTRDIDGNARGIAGQRYDIGAFEFTGRMNVSDVELVDIQAPGAYMSGNGSFNDAEYIMTEAPVEVKARLRNNGSLQQSDINVRVRIYRQLPNGLYSTTPTVDQTVKADLATTESVDVTFNLADKTGVDFNPQTYGDLRPQYNVPSIFSSMEANVTPKYKIEVSVESDQANGNNIMTKEVRFYLKRSPLKLLVSAENTTADLYYSGTPTVDEIAGRLNFDTLMAGFRYLGWYTDLDEGKMDIDIFDRGSWEPRSVNYTMYRSMFWSDGDDKAITRYQKQDIEKFLDVAVGSEKKNLVIGSQEMVRRHSQNDANRYPEFINGILRSQNEAPENPLGFNQSNDGNSVIGVSVGKDLEETIKTTGYGSDMPPYCGLMSVYPDGAGLATVAYVYRNHGGNPNVNTMGVATTTLTRNVVNLGVDWRHFSNIETLLRQVMDYIEKNGGDVVPVELAEFDATPVGKRVDITWATASELGSSKFEVEKATVSEAGRGEYGKLSEVSAAGQSSVRIDYGPVVDYAVEYGNRYSYRLKMIDLNGDYKYSDERVVTIEGQSGYLRMGDAKPNPASGEIKFEVTAGVEMSAEVQLYDASGKYVMTVFSGKLTSGVTELKADLSALVSGSYTLVLRSGDVTLTKAISVVK
jgi:hypothetical protein